MELLKRGEGGMTVAQIAEPLAITPVAVRRHLSTLEAEGLVKVVVKRLPVGRPAYLYTLTESADGLFPQGYSQLLLDILEELALLDGEEKVELLFQRRKERLKAAYAHRLEGKDLAGKVAELTHLFAEVGHMPAYQALEDGSFVLREHNCPIAQVAKRFKVICEWERVLLEELLGTKVERMTHIPGGDSFCSYHLSATGDGS